jgi:hypothetical protein
VKQVDTDVKIVSIGGMPRSGKDSLAELFIKNGYYGVSLGDIVRDVSMVRHKDSPDPISVAHMTETSNWLRTTQGPDFALKQALVMYKNAAKKGGSYKGLIIWSIRAPVEVDFILANHGELIWLEASDEVRYERAMKFIREGEGQMSLDEFKAQEDLQWVPQAGIPDSVQMNISYVKSHATRTLENDEADIGVFETKAQKLIQDLIQN